MALNNWQSRSPVALYRLLVRLHLYAFVRSFLVMLSCLTGIKPYHAEDACNSFDKIMAWKTTVRQSLTGRVCFLVFQMHARENGWHCYSLHQKQYEASLSVSLAYITHDYRPSISPASSLHGAKRHGDLFIKLKIMDEKGWNIISAFLIHDYVVISLVCS